MGEYSDLNFIELDLDALKALLTAPDAPVQTPAAYRLAVAENLVGLQSHARTLFAALREAPPSGVRWDRTFEP